MWILSIKWNGKIDGIVNLIEVGLNSEILNVNMKFKIVSQTNDFQKWLLYDYIYNYEIMYNFYIRLPMPKKWK